jgi:hypothetical protein
MRLALTCVVLLLVLTTQGAVRNYTFAEDGSQTCTIMVYLGSFKVVETGTRSAGDQWSLVAEVNGFRIAEWDYRSSEGFRQTPSIQSFRSPNTSLEIRASATEHDDTPDIGAADEIIELDCPSLEGSPRVETLDVRVVEDRGAAGRVPSYYTVWRFEFVLSPLFMQYHE